MEQLDMFDHGIGVEDVRLRLEPIDPERHMRVPDRIELTGDAELIERERAQRLEQPVVLLAARSFVRDHEVLVDQPAHNVEHTHRFDVAHRRRDHLGRLHRKGSGEDAEATEHDLLVLVQPVVAPFHRRGEGLLAREDGAGAAREEMEAIVELEGDALGGHLATTSGGELQRERDAIEAMADLRDRRGVRIGDHERRAGAARAIDEQADRLVLRQRGYRQDRLGRRSRQRTDPPRDLARNAERLAGSREHLHGAVLCQERRGEPGTRFDEVLTVVQHQERRSVRQGRIELLDGFESGHLVGTERSQHCRPDRILICDARELDEPHASGELLQQIRGHVERKSCLAHAAGSGQRHQSLRADEPSERGDVLVSSDERRDLDREVVRVRVEGLQLWVRRRQVGVDDLPHALRAAEILEAVHPEVGQARVLGQPVDDEPRGRVRYEDLIAVPDGAQPSAADHGLAEVVAFVAQLRLARVDRHAHVEVAALGPLLTEEPSLRVDRGGDGIGRACERRDDAVALPLLDGSNATMVSDDLVEDLVVPRDGHRHRARSVLPPSRRPLDVSEEEADCAGRQRESGCVRAAHVVHQELHRAKHGSPAPRRHPPSGGPTSRLPAERWRRPGRRSTARPTTSAGGRADWSRRQGQPSSPRA